MNELQQLLVSGLPLFISVDGFRQAMLSGFPLTGKAEIPSMTNLSLSQADAAYLGQHTFYQYQSHKALELLNSKMSMDDNFDEVTLTDKFSLKELPENSIAYHRIFGMIISDSYWYFSSKQLNEDLMAAEANPQISCHMLHINSPGGEAWFLDRLSETLRNCKKPILTIYEKMCASAGYYIGCHGNKVYALTQNDYVGCIGTMVDFYSFKGYFEKLGITEIKAKATNSDLKNKTFEDLEDGKSEKYIKEVLDPMNIQFLDEVKSQRAKLTELGDDAPVLRGETFYTPAAIEIGLCDGSRTFIEAVAEAVTMGKNYTETVKLKNAIYNV